MRITPALFHPILTALEKFEPQSNLKDSDLHCSVWNYCIETYFAFRRITFPSKDWRIFFYPLEGERVDLSAAAEFQTLVQWVRRKEFDQSSYAVP
ncbi:hypothetical protein NPIL_359471 [Nephila pilipes]|uniref:Uncharacterized protein n=1 Tax=Nephila pilipes TaxID=299642 RepID=A0A8X6P345_NEPPI|nr:hypothetical protein NPIL_359471 [Nephila pilipes]